MGAAQRQVKRDQIKGVLVNSTLMYEFRTKDFSPFGVSDGDLTSQLGHYSFSTSVGTGLRVSGSRAPQPTRVSKKVTGRTQGSVSTFCAYDKVANARNNGWNITKSARRVAIKKTQTKETVAAEVGGLLYCWVMPSADANIVAPVLGLKRAAEINSPTELARCVSGSNTPRPGRVTVNLQEGGSISTFYSPDAPFGGGYSYTSQTDAVLFQAPTSP